MNTIVVTNDAGRSFTCRLVLPGQTGASRHGVSRTPVARPGQVNNTDYPLVEVFDDTYANDPRFPDLGQFVADYLSFDLGQTTGGLYMGGQYWVLSAQNVADISAAFGWASRTMEESK